MIKGLAVTLAVGVKAVWEHPPKVRKPSGYEEQKGTGTWLGVVRRPVAEDCALLFRRQNH